MTCEHGLDREQVDCAQCHALAARLAEAERVLDHIASYGFPFDADVAAYKRGEPLATADSAPAAHPSMPYGTRMLFEAVHCRPDESPGPGWTLTARDDRCSQWMRPFSASAT